MTFAVDASVMLAMIFEEPGTNGVFEVIRGGMMSTVNFSEVLTKCLEQGADADFAEWQIGRLNISREPFTVDDAKAAAALRLPTRYRGLSLGDRACLALALRANVPVITADRQWDGLDVGVEIRVIR
ncbi:type II toxin-antitoxin system VapC family toxin [Blastomonas sp.]|uniref:type II toxin-antitoxin system VapC family toxin n=1 Tax=Blastomonas sp. TaxID=1909299 RepID=UPI0039198617